MAVCKEAYSLFTALTVQVLIWSSIMPIIQSSMIIKATKEEYLSALTSEQTCWFADSYRARLPSRRVDALTGNESWVNWDKWSIKYSMQIIAHPAILHTMFDCRNIDQCVEYDKMDDYYLYRMCDKNLYEYVRTFITTDNRNYEPSYMLYSHWMISINCW